MPRYALVIGIAKYEKFRGLPKAATDAEAIAKLLEDNHYNVTRLPGQLVAENQWAIDPTRNLTGQELKKELKTFLQERASGQEALIYFAGHGFLVKDEFTDEKKGYLATSDSTKNGDNAVAFEDLNTLINKSKLSSLVVLLDCCYAGSLIEERRNLLQPTQITIGQQQNSCFLAACRDFELDREGEKGGIFTAAVLKGLSPQQAKNEKITSTDLFGFVSQELEKSGQEVIHAGIGKAITLVQYSQEPREHHLPLEGHYQIVVDAFRAGKIIPFLGSDVNLIGRPQQLKKWFFGCPYLPTNSELAEFLAERFGYFQNPTMGTIHKQWQQLKAETKEELEEMALQHWMQYSANQAGMGVLYDTLRQVFNSKNYHENYLYRFFTQVLSDLMGEKFKELLIVTTNLDGGLEDAFRKAGKPFDLIYYSHQDGKFFHQQPQQEPIQITSANTYRGGLFEDRPVILRLCGPKDWNEDEKFVVSEDCYINYLVDTNISKRLPAKLLAKLNKGNHLYFLGYSLSNWYQRLILQRIWKAPRLVSEKYIWWSIQSRSRLLDGKLWSQWADVDVIERPLDDYIAGLETYLQKNQDINPN